MKFSEEYNQNDDFQDELDEIKRLIADAQPIYDDADLNQSSNSDMHTEDGTAIPEKEISSDISFESEQNILSESKEHKAEAENDKQSAVKRVTVELYDWAQALVSAVIIIIVIFVFVGRVLGVVGGSMNPTFTEGDQVVLWSAFYRPEAGDIVVLTKESYSSTTPIIKRVIAVENQTVDIDFDTGNVFVDGRLLEEDYILEPTTAYSDVQFPVTVPENCIFVMGDNRNASTDSRNSRIGMVDVRCVIGKVVFRIWPVSEMGLVY